MPRPFVYDDYFDAIQQDIDALNAKADALEKELSSYGYLADIAVRSGKLVQTVCRPQAYRPDGKGIEFVREEVKLPLPTGVGTLITKIEQGEVEKTAGKPDQVILKVTRSGETGTVAFDVPGRQGPAGDKGEHGKNESADWGTGVVKDHGNVTYYLQDGTKVLDLSQAGTSVGMTALSVSVSGAAAGVTGLNVSVAGSETVISGTKARLSGVTTSGTGVEMKASGLKGALAAVGMSVSVVSAVVAAVLNKAGVLNGEHKAVGTRLAFSVRT